MLPSRPIQNFVEEIVIMKHKITDKDIEKMNLSDWAKYLNESVYVIWFEILGITISKYPSVSKNLM